MQIDLEDSGQSLKLCQDYGSVLKFTWKAETYDFSLNIKILKTQHKVIHSCGLLFNSHCVKKLYIIQSHTCNDECYNSP